MKKLVLTFDDGPDPLYTRNILDVLKDHKVSATFFVVAQDAIDNQNLIERMKKENHCIALHSLQHRHAFLCSYFDMKYDFSKSLELLNSMNCDVKFYRPPWGARNIFTKMFIKRFNLHMVLWDVMAQDWKSDCTPEQIANKIRKRVFDGAIICLHDGGEKYGGAKGAPFQTIEALKIVIPALKEEGYEFVTIEEFYRYG